LTESEQVPAQAGTNSLLDRHRWTPRWSRADVQLIGRVGTDPEVRFSGEADGRAWARLRIATENPGGSEDSPDWHTVIVRDRLAQFAARYITRGRLVHVAGWLTYRTLDRRGGAHHVAEIHAAQILLLDKPQRTPRVSEVPAEDREVP